MGLRSLHLTEELFFVIKLSSTFYVLWSCLFFTYDLFGSIDLGTQVFDTNFESYFLVHICLVYTFSSFLLFSLEKKEGFILLCFV